MKEIYRGDKQPPKRLSDDEIRDEIEDNPAIIYYSYDKLTGEQLYLILSNFFPKIWYYKNYLGGNGTLYLG